MQHSNTYIIVFASVLTIVLGGLLSLAATSLKERQQKAIDLDTKKQILGAVMTLKEGDDALAIYSERIEGVVVDNNGDVIQDAKPADKINIRKQYKAPDSERQYPVFIFKDESGKPDAYILPVYGSGLWDAIWGFVALAPDFNTVKGMAMAHKGETPGLGARIDTKEVQNRYVGKKFYNEKGELVSIDMVKGEGGTAEANEALGPHKVDGMSGATITGDGVDVMLKKYMERYENYFAKMKKQSVPEPAPEPQLPDSLQMTDSATVAVDSAQAEVATETVAD